MHKQTDGTAASMQILPPGPGKCPVCAGAHEPRQPHNKHSLYYRMKFRQAHGRYPDWRDAMAHCPPDVQDWWRIELTKRGIKLEEDRSDGEPGTDEKPTA